MSVKNIWLKLRSCARSIFAVRPKKFIVPSSYYLFNNNLLTSKSNWNISSYFYDDIIFKDGELSLGVDCFVSCKRHFKYGIYSCDIKLPVGPKIHGAFEFNGVIASFPNISIVESFCDSDGYINDVRPGLILRNFYGVIDKCRSYNMCVDNPDDWHNYVLWWDEEFIKVYYDGHLVYEYTDNVPSVFMSLNLTNCLMPLGSDYDKAKYSAMRVRDLKYYKKYE